MKLDGTCLPERHARLVAALRAAVRWLRENRRLTSGLNIPPEHAEAIRKAVE